jgi:hypothetical protein
MGIMEATATIITAIKEIVPSLTIKKSVFSVLLIIFLVFGSFYCYESFTGHFYFKRLNKKIDLLVKIDEQLPTDSLLKKDIQKEYRLITKIVSQYKIQRKLYLGGAISLTKKQSQNIMKAISALIIPLLISLFYIRGKPKKEKIDTMVGVIFIGIISALIAILIPIIYRPWINYVGFPIIQVAILFVIGKVMK